MAAGMMATRDVVRSVARFVAEHARSRNPFTSYIGGHVVDCDALLDHLVKTFAADVGKSDVSEWIEEWHAEQAQQEAGRS